MGRLLAIITAFCFVFYPARAEAARRFIHKCEVVYLDYEAFRSAYQVVFVHPAWSPDFGKPPSGHLEIVSSMALFGANDLPGAFLNERIFVESAIDRERIKLENKYFGFLEGFDDQEFKGLVKEVEQAIPKSYKTFLGVYDPADEKLIGMIRTLRVPTENHSSLAISLILNKLGVDFNATEIFERFPGVANKSVIRQAGMAWREKSDEGADARKIWELFLGGTNGTGPKDELMLVMSDAARSTLYVGRYGFEIQYRLFKSKNGKWQIEHADRIKRDAPESEKSEYILAASTGTVRGKLMDRVLTDESYWGLFEREPSIRNFFETMFTDGAGMSRIKLEPRYSNYFSRFPSGLGR